MALLPRYLPLATRRCLPNIIDSVSLTSTPSNLLRFSTNSLAFQDAQSLHFVFSAPRNLDQRLSASQNIGTKLHNSYPQPLLAELLRDSILPSTSLNFAISHSSSRSPNISLANMPREAATREWAVKFENDVLSKPEHTHLRPTTTTQDIVNLKDALNGHYEKKPISDCALAFMRPLKSLYTRYPSERGERTVLKCLKKAIKNRFARGDDTGMPGLILPDVLMAKKLAAEVMRRSGSVEQLSGNYEFSLPNEKTSWVNWVKVMEENKPNWPKKGDFTTTGQYDTAMGLAEQEWWETWANEIEKAWGCYIYNAIPIHLREPIVSQDADGQRLSDYKGHDGKDFETGGRDVDHYKSPMDWNVDFTFHLLLLSQMSIKAHRTTATEWMTDEVKARLQKSRTIKLPWLTPADLKKIVANVAKRLDQVMVVA
ncbi:hypothetical protein IWX49DRAFT_591861 [Phyllosticta citricarpa]|uniref:Uncharacterized protein n=2 Tax=Phyllosticta TaxID=121621 RepID=A0ABR1MJ21_9PEZI